MLDTSGIAVFVLVSEGSGVSVSVAVNDGVAVIGVCVAVGVAD